MIELLAPWAAAGAILLAGPLLVHMLLRRNARRLIFPAAHFLPATRAAAVRLRRPSDVGLLVLRMAIAGAAIAAALQPIVITPQRVSRWNARVIRAVVVDTSASAAAGGDGARLAEQELTSFRAQRFDGTDLRDGLARAAAWLAAAPPGRREVVILSDFQQGALEREDLRVLPAGAGVRTIRVHGPPRGGASPLPQVSGFRDAVWRPSVNVDARGTGVTWTKTADGSRAAWLTTAEAEAERDAASRAVYAATAAGVAAGDDTHRVRIRFAGAPPDAASRSEVRTPWMVNAALALRRSGLLRDADAAIQTAEQAGALVVETNVRAASLAAPAVVRAVVLAVRPPAIADREAEVLTVPDAELASWRRDAAPLAMTTYRPSGQADGDSDARWFWGIALALLGVETWLRRRDAGAAERQVRDAA
ncbi:MAG TPA: BatA domain-containing protein [Vicinamibacterales bacterium]|nr:BatA domain-containing protein [Vicinamibacterales bacterium]